MIIYQRLYQSIKYYCIFFLIQLILVFNPSTLYTFFLIFSLNKISKITLLVFRLTFCSFRKQTKEVNIFAGASLVFRIFLCSDIQKDHEKLVIAHYKESIEKTMLLNRKSSDILRSLDHL